MVPIDLAPVRKQPDLAWMLIHPFGIGVEAKTKNEVGFRRKPHRRPHDLRTRLRIEPVLRPDAKRILFVPSEPYRHRLQMQPLPVVQPARIRDHASLGGLSPEYDGGGRLSIDEQTRESVNLGDLCRMLDVRSQFRVECLCGNHVAGDVNRLKLLLTHVPSLLRQNVILHTKIGPAARARRSRDDDRRRDVGARLAVGDAIGQLANATAGRRIDHLLHVRSPVAPFIRHHEIGEILLLPVEPHEPFAQFRIAVFRRAVREQAQLGILRHRKRRQRDDNPPLRVRLDDFKRLFAAHVNNAQGSLGALAQVHLRLRKIGPPDELLRRRNRARGTDVVPAGRQCVCRQCRHRKERQHRNIPSRRSNHTVVSPIEW